VPAGAIETSVRGHRDGIVGAEPQDDRVIMVYLFS
jgi:hypothetical protein